MKKQPISTKALFEKDLHDFSHIYVDIRDDSGFAFYFEGKILDVYEKEEKLYFNQNYLSMDYGFFSIKLPWEKLRHENHIYSLIHAGFRASILFVQED